MSSIADEPGCASTFDHASNVCVCGVSTGIMHFVGYVCVGSSVEFLSPLLLRARGQVAAGVIYAMKKKHSMSRFPPHLFMESHILAQEHAPGLWVYTGDNLGWGCRVREELLPTPCYLACASDGVGISRMRCSQKRECNLSRMFSSDCNHSRKGYRSGSCKTMRQISPLYQCALAPGRLVVYSCRYSFTGGFDGLLCLHIEQAPTLPISVSPCCPATVRRS